MGRDIGRVSKNQVEGAAGPRAAPVAPYETDVPEAQPQGIAASQPESGTRMVQGQNPAVGPGTGEGEGEHAAAGAPLEDARAPRQFAQGLFGQQFGLRSGGQDLRVEAQRKIQEFAFTAQVCDRMTVLPAVDQEFSPCLLRRCERPLRMRQHPGAGAAQGVAPEPVGIARRAVAAGTQSGTGLKQRLAQGERLSRHRPDRPVAWPGVPAARGRPPDRGRHRAFRAGSAG